VNTRERSAWGRLLSRIPRLCWGLFWAVIAGAALAATWLPLAGDGIHDPLGPGIALLQQPREALAVLPPDMIGNQVSWSKAIEQGQIKPRTHVLVRVDMPVRDTEVILKNTGEMPMVKFPHRAHTAWLDCGSCHDELFSRVAGTTKINMAMILRGEKCGLCHGAVAFPLTECARCHSVARQIGPRLANERK
jgi:c(7)-type cytochrome triheme protein